MKPADLPAAAELPPADDLCVYAKRPSAFFARYIRARPLAHAAILLGVLGAVTCSVSTQYGVKALVDALGAPNRSGPVWAALGLLIGLIAADNLLWRFASLVASFTFVRVTGDLRRDLLRHLTGHAPAFFADRQPGTLASRVTATSNAFFTVESMAVYNVLPPCGAAVCAIAFISSVNLTMAAAMTVVCGIMMIVMFRLAAAGRPLHHDYADKAAAVDGEVVDLVGNISLVKSFGGLPREFARMSDTLEREMKARRGSLLYLERLRVLHAVVVIVSTVGLLIWAVRLWEAGEATAGQVVLCATLGLSILSSTRDLAVALVDATQHVARLAEALETLLLPHELRDHPDARRLIPRSASVRFEEVTFAYPNGPTICDAFSLEVPAGQWLGLIGPSGGGKSTLFALLQRFYDIGGGRILVDGQDVQRVTQDSLREAMTVVPQDISLFHRTLMENLRYGCPDASDEEVRQAAAAAHCDEFIADLPDGYETIVGDRGTKLSGGQRQRVAIARALLKNAPILLLDEATSALDSRSEGVVKDALANLMKGRTVIAIAHRLSTLRSFDRIVQIEGGKIVQDGPPDQVMRPDLRGGAVPLSEDDVDGSVRFG